MFRVILSEAVLRTPLADAQRWREQLERLSEAAERTNTTVQVLPYDAVRDLALPSARSRKFILRMLEEVPCEPLT